jgi:hypothetical protein
MSSSPNIILYHAYGLTSLYNQVRFSLLTLYYQLQGRFQDLQIVIYTDKPEVFSSYMADMPIKIELLDKQMIATYKGKANFVHRVKICIIKDCFEKYKSNILYLDSDTYFTRSPLSLIQQITPQTSVMNADDYDLMHAAELFENEDWLLIRRAIRDFNYTIDGNNIKIPLTTRMWNAGVIGMNVANEYLLNDVLDLTDQIYNNKKVFTAEQFAFSYFLQNKTQLISSGDVIFHYWPNFKGKYWKNIYDDQFKTFFKKHGRLPVTQQSKLAYQLTLQHDELVKPRKMTMMQKVLYRLKLMSIIAAKGKLPKNI